MTFYPMKPETIERRAFKRAKDVAERRAILIARLREKVAAGDDPAGIYAGMLEEALARQS